MRQSRPKLQVHHTGTYAFCSRSATQQLRKRLRRSISLRQRRGGHTSSLIGTCASCEREGRQTDLLAMWSSTPAVLYAFSSKYYTKCAIHGANAQGICHTPVHRSLFDGNTTVCACACCVRYSELRSQAIRETDNSKLKLHSCCSPHHHFRMVATVEEELFPHPKKYERQSSWGHCPAPTAYLAPQSRHGSPVHRNLIAHAILIRLCLERIDIFCGVEVGMDKL